MIHMGFQTPLERDLWEAMNAVWEECSADNPASKILSELYDKYKECIVIRPEVHHEDNGVWIPIPMVRWIRGEDTQDAMFQAQEEMLKIR